jgi:hypothetical protein
MFADWFKFSLIEELTYEIDAWFQEKFLTNDALDLIWSPASRAEIFGWIIISGQLYFPYLLLYIYYFTGRELKSPT